MPGLEGCLHCMGLDIRRAPKPGQCAEVPTLCWEAFHAQAVRHAGPPLMSFSLLCVRCPDCEAYMHPAPTEPGLHDV